MNALGLSIHGTPMRYRCLLCLLLLPGLGVAQEVGTCGPATASRDLDVGNVRARLYNSGGLFWQGSNAVYTVPKDKLTDALFAHGLWIGGLVEGDLHMAASDYGPWEFWPGPLDADGNPPVDCTPYDRMYKISRADLAVYGRDGTLTNDLRDWPAHLGAPVYDGDGVSGNYDLAGGDRPALLGDQMVWWVMNDLGNEHRWSREQPIGLEIQVTAFAFDNAAYNSPIDPVLVHSTFYRYRLVYKGAAPWEGVYFGLFNDPDLGDAGDDYVGSDSTLHMGYVYNGDDFDGSTGGYGDRPPALGNVFLQGPALGPDGQDNDRDGTTDEPGERAGMATFAYYNGDSTVQGNPDTAEHVYHYLRGRWRDGLPITYGGSGRGFTVERTSFMFSGDPPAYWTEENIDGEGSRNTPADRRFIMSTGPFRMEPGEVQDILVGIVWARGADRLDSVYKLKSVVHGLHVVGPEVLLQARIPPPAPPTPGPDRYVVYRNYPNPFTTRTTLAYDLPQERLVHLVVYDVLGRPVRTLVDQVQPPGHYTVDFDATALPSGLYLAQLRVGHLERTLPLLRHP